MNKIVLNFGLLVFFISMIIYSQKGLDIIDVFIRSFALFMVVTVMFTIISIIFIKAINDASARKARQMNEKFIGNNKHE